MADPKQSRVAFMRQMTSNMELCLRHLEACRNAEALEGVRIHSIDAASLVVGLGICGL